jgi:lipid-binding SYLF domain-containing protein
MRLPIAAAVATTGVLTATLAFGQLSKDDLKRLNNATTVLSEFRNSSDIPGSMWTRANCVLVIPSLKKAAFIIGGEFGSGVMSCRQSNGAWGPPVFMQMTKGSAGFQVGAESTELVLFVMNAKGADRLLSNKVTLGTDASIAAGPVGRSATASTDVQLTAEMLSYSHSKGLFAGINLSGGALAPNKDANERAYGSTASVKSIALGTTPVTALAAARPFIDALARDTRATTGVK